MMTMLRQSLFVVTIACGLAFPSPVARAADPLPSWQEGKTKQSIMDFVAAVTTPGSPNFVPPADRIAVFDNDGTLWAEQPLYFQFIFAIDRIKALAPQHPEWKTQEPFASVLKGDVKGVLAGGEPAIVQLLTPAQSGMTTDEFEQTVRDWLATARHPTTKRLYTERVYGIPPEQVVGSTGKVSFEWRDGKPVLMKLSAIQFVDDGPGKPVGIHQFIAQRPIAAFGNSDGDLEMLQWTFAGPGKSFCLYVHHDDAVREWAYDRNSSIGRLDKGLDQAAAHGWTVVSMKNDWKTIFAEVPAKPEVTPSSGSPK
jgi:hypothetical protein